MCVRAGAPRAEALFFLFFLIIQYHASCIFGLAAIWCRGSRAGLAGLERFPAVTPHGTPFPFHSSQAKQVINEGRVTARRWLGAGERRDWPVCGEEGKHHGKKAQLEDLDVKSKMAAVQRGFYPPVNAAIAESRLSSLATLYYSFHTFEFFHLPQEERGGGGRQIKPPSMIDARTPHGQRTRGLLGVGSQIPS